MGQTHQTEQNDPEIDVKALQDMYKKFVTECPSGVLFIHEFKRFFGVDPTGEVSEEPIVCCMFLNFDNTIDFLEFVASLNLVFQIKVYDKDGNGYVDRTELREGMQLSVNEVCERILKTVDVDRDGHFTLEEFIKGAQGDPWIMNMLQLDMNPYGWVLEQRRKSAHF
uniref:Guanylyl cyclase-activating protein 2 n=1 Tax=Hucho hucho TaxID=62062 RepID=A0A4W5PUN6_9TELE